MQEDSQHILKLVEQCIAGKRASQKEFYRLYHGYALSICLRYSRNREDAVEMMNDGFLKVFTYLRKFDMSKPIKPWLRRIMINSAIDHINKFQQKLDEKYVDDQIKSLISQNESGPVSYKDLLDMVRQLPQAYRAVFNLYAIEGYKHAEIASMLGISEGTSKSNYFRAKKRLQDLLATHFDVRVDER